MRKNVWFTGLTLFVLVSSPGLASPPPPVCYTWADLTSYFVPSYPGWQTARETWQQTLPPAQPTYFRKLLYGPSKFEMIKFNDPHSSETYAWDTGWIYITAENGINGGSDTRIYPSGYDGYFLGQSWMPRVACSSGVSYWQFNTFFPCYSSQVYYSNCNSCPCQYNHTNPQHCAKYQSVIAFTNYNYGGSLGTIQTAIKDDTYDDLSGYERYFYALGYGLLRFEAYSGWPQGQLILAGQVTAITPNDPIADQACFHP